jgi:hypothetical protein
MKKQILFLATTLLLCALIPHPLMASADVVPDKKAPTEITTTIDTDALIARLSEIENMDKSNLSFSEKRELRAEVRSINEILVTLNSGGVYLSVGALILVVVLLILLL